MTNKQFDQLADLLNTSGTAEEIRRKLWDMELLPRHKYLTQTTPVEADQIIAKLKEWVRPLKQLQQHVAAEGIRGEIEQQTYDRFGLKPDDEIPQ